LSNVQELIRILVAPADRFEAAAQAVLVGFRLDDAVGAQLETLGSLVGQPRAGLNDDDFRRFIRARILTTRSSGTIDEILTILDLVLGDPAAILTFVDEWPAAFSVQITGTVVDPDMADILVSFLRAAASAGVRALLEPTLDPEANLLHFDSDNFDQERMIPALE
jgi:hypothetical protein